ncbi:hypothetical protein [Alkalicoccus chagannorensis]|nr:hypothetical protein [Alkalicoccus chagannorensis]
MEPAEVIDRLRRTDFDSEGEAAEAAEFLREEYGVDIFCAK